MEIRGIDFTAAPARRKPITAAICHLEGARLRLRRLERIETLAGFESFLAQPGPWVAGFDFPFGQSRRLIDGLGWPRDWAGYVGKVGAMGLPALVETFEAYKAPRPPGDRQHFRAADRATGAASPQTLHYTPVARMFAQGAPRLLAAGVHVPGLCAGDPARVALEAYPGVAARALIGRRPYKSDQRADPARAAARADLIAALSGAAGRARFGLDLVLPGDLAAEMAADPRADLLDAVICAVQAAWALRAGLTAAGPSGVDPLEGWIADPAALPPS
ncbi:DUF429 domain-containing protein [Phaeovulum vinaykumarii]|uniref:DUF429 domain-containing protein n=1 Tax=Phaeovulum vinaykumarii TaxID=407234 RepID=A0A1N7JJL1_9RHOB|nr:DUF429 domain-containing protein [Phaeovulum vinaykumarii]SIS49451.1 Protein of unknown function [Phaeovulum vinaykumarii]SOB89705.1 uncharacterized protein DUF429 [Phaeovulum vinaykumarii]